MDTLSDLANLLITLKHAGVSLRAAGPTDLRASPATLLTSDLRARIKTHKIRILTWLRTGDLVAEVYTETPARERLRAEIQNRPWLTRAQRQTAWNDFDFFSHWYRDEKNTPDQAQHRAMVTVLANLRLIPAPALRRAS